MRPNANVARYRDYQKEGNGLHISLLDSLHKKVPKAKIEFDDGKWITEPGIFTAWAGGNSRAERTIKFDLKPAIPARKP